MGGGGGFSPSPIFLTLFFDQIIVPKKVIFYPKLTIFVGFSVFFVIIIIKITKILIKIIMATIIIIISIFFPPYPQNVVFVGRIKSVKLPELGGGGEAMTSSHQLVISSSSARHQLVISSSSACHQLVISLSSVRHQRKKGKSEKKGKRE